MNKGINLNYLPEKKRDRWILLETLISIWYRPIQEEDGYSLQEIDYAHKKLNIILPSALIEWYQSSGKRKDIWSNQDVFISPYDLAIENNLLIFYLENQGVVSWGIPVSELDLDDPKVIMVNNEIKDQMVIQTNSISQFALYMFEYTIQFSEQSYWFCGYTADNLIDILKSNYVQYEFPDNWWTGTKLFGSEDIIVSVDKYNCFNVTAKTKDKYVEIFNLLPKEKIEIHASYLDDK